MLWLVISPARRSRVVNVMSVDLPDSFAPCNCIRPSAYQPSAASYSHRFTTPARSGCQRSERTGSGSFPSTAATRHDVSSSSVVIGDVLQRAFTGGPRVTVAACDGKNGPALPAQPDQAGLDHLRFHGRRHYHLSLAEGIRQCSDACAVATR